MKKRLLLIFAAAILAISAVSCKDTPDNLPKSPSDSEVESGATDTDNGNTESGNTEVEKTPEVPEVPEVPEIVEPVGDTYSYEENTEANGYFEIVGELEDSEYVIFTNDFEKYGICDINGQTVVKPEYTTLGWCPWHEVVYAEPFAEGDEPVVISDKYKIDLHYAHGGFGRTTYLFDENASRMFTVGADIEVFYINEVETIPVNTPYICYSGDVKVEQGEAYPGGDSEELYHILEATVFGEADYEIITDKGSIVPLGKCANVGFFKNDFLMLSRGGKFGFVNLFGKDACEFKYVNAIPAFDSRAWVKTENEGWKVVNLKGI